MQVSQVRLDQINEFLTDLNDRRGKIYPCGNCHNLVVELNGGDFVEMWAYEPDASTFRGEYYYNTASNVLYRRIISNKNVGGEIAYWMRVSR